MTEKELREKILNNARAFLNIKEGDSRHALIVNTYNAIRPLPRNYTLTTKDAWCAAFVSAIFKMSNMSAIIPSECSCYYMVEGFKKLNRWVEDDAYKPTEGDIVFYDWEDTGRGDNTGVPDHVGIVELVSSNVITVIEGNYSDSVKRRNIPVNGKYIRGFGKPDYAALVSTTVPWYGKDGSWADGTKLGFVDGNRPDAYATRAEVNVMILRAIDYLRKEGV